jgi:hypothetical protein
VITLSFVVASCSTVGNEIDSHSLDNLTDDDISFQYFDAVNYSANFLRARDHALTQSLLLQMDTRSSFSVEQVERMKAVAQVSRRLNEEYRRAVLSFRRSFHANEIENFVIPQPDSIRLSSIRCEGGAGRYSVPVVVHEYIYRWPSVRKFPRVPQPIISPRYNLRIYWRNGAYQAGAFMGYREVFFVDDNNHSSYEGGRTGSCDFP